MASFVILRHPVTNLVTDLTNPDNLTNDPLIPNSFDNTNLARKNTHQVQICWLFLPCTTLPLLPFLPMLRLACGTVVQDRR